MIIIIYCYQDFYYLNDIGTVLGDSLGQSPAGQIVGVFSMVYAAFSGGKGIVIK